MENAVVKEVPVGNPVGNPDWPQCLQHVCHLSSDGKVITTLRKPSSSYPVSEGKPPATQGLVFEDLVDNDDLYA